MNFVRTMHSEEVCQGDPFVSEHGGKTSNLPTFSNFFAPFSIFEGLCIQIKREKWYVQT